MTETPSSAVGDRMETALRGGPGNYLARFPARIGQLVPRLRSAPVTLGYVALLWAATGVPRILNVYHVPFRAGLGSVAAAPSSLFIRPWSVASSAFWLPQPLYYLAGTVAVLLAGFPLERRLGSARYAAAVAASQILGVTAAAGLVWSIHSTMGSWPVVLMSDRYVGPTAALCGVLMAASTTMSVLWRRRLRTALLTLLLLLVLYEGSYADLVRIFSATAGLLLGPFFFGRRPVFAWPRMSRREVRVLVALGVAAFAIGPVIAGLSRHAPAPLAVLRLLSTDLQPVNPQALRSACSPAPRSAECQMMLLQLRAGAGGIFMAILPCFLLLLSAEGLRRGRRFAWWSALAVLGSTAVLAAIHIAGVLWPRVLGTLQEQDMDFQDLSHLHNKWGLVIPLLLPGVMFLLVLRFRDLFPASAPAGTYARLGRWVLMLGTGLAVIYVGAGTALADGFTPVPTPAQFLADVPDRFLPLGYTLDIPPAIFPESAPAVMVYEGTGIVFWALTGILVLRSFLQTPPNPHPLDPSRVRNILRSGTGNPLSWMTTWPGNRYWFTPEGDGYVAYRVNSGVALALGSPVGSAAGYRTCVAGFARFCEENGWTPCFYSADQSLRDEAAAKGWSSIEVALQTILPLAALSFAGRQFQHIRTKINRARKEGIQVEWINYAQAPPAIRQQIDDISKEWVGDKKLPELGFTLGGIAELQDPEVRCLVALDADGTVHGVTSWLPSYSNGRIVGWTLDLMRRRTNGFPNSMELLIATAALTLRDEGYSYVSLSGAPLANSLQTGDGAAPSTALERVLDWCGNRLEPVYGFRSLLAFKNKFAPHYEPLYLVYNDAAALPAIANAITTAYLGDISTLRRLGLAGQLLLPRTTGTGRAAG